MTTTDEDREIRPLVFLSAACEVLAGRDELDALESTWAHYAGLEAAARAQLTKTEGGAT